MSNQLVAIIGSRMLPIVYKEKMREVIKQLLEKGYDIASGGALGADEYALESLLELGAAKRGVTFSAWTGFVGFPFSVQPQIREFAKQGGRIIWGTARPHSPRPEIVAGLLGRNRKLVESCCALIAYPFGESRGTMYTIKRAEEKGIPVKILTKRGDNLLTHAKN